MRYYCNVCKKDITKGVFDFSMDIFGRALCREHQEIERRSQEESSQCGRMENQTVEQESSEINSENFVDSAEGSIDAHPKSDGKSLSKRIALKMGKGVVKGIKKVADSSKKRNQNRKWKSAILRRMTMSQLKHLCFERNISTKKTVLNEILLLE